MDEDIRTRMRSQRSDDHKEIHHSVRSVPSVAPEPTAVRPKNINRKKPGPKKIILFLAVLIILTVAVGGWLVIKPQADGNSFPKSIQQRVSFPVYYPGTLPQGYAYLKDSAKVTGPNLIYKLSNSGKIIIVTEQAVPTAPPDLNTLAGFERLYAPSALSAVIGETAGQPVAIVLTKTTLISASGTSGVSKDSLGQAAANMSSL